MIMLLDRRLVAGLALVPLFCLGGICGRLFLAVRAGPAVVVDPGHGGIDGGCQDGRGNLEKDLNLAISRRVAAHLREAGYAAHLTRADDRALGETYGRDLMARVDAARQTRARALVSVHANWCRDPSATGALMVVPPAAPQSMRLAKAIGARLQGLCPVNPEPLVMPDHPLLAAESFPIVLVEVGFLSNPAEAARLQTAAYQDALGRAIAQGIEDFLRAAPPAAIRSTR